MVFIGVSPLRRDVPPGLLPSYQFAQLLWKGPASEGWCKTRRRTPRRRLREFKKRTHAQSVSAFRHRRMQAVVKQPCLWATTGKVPVAGGEAATRWGRTQTSGTEPPATGYPDICIRKSVGRPELGLPKRKKGPLRWRNDPLRSAEIGDQPLSLRHLRPLTLILPAELSCAARHNREVIPGNYVFL